MIGGIVVGIVVPIAIFDEQPRLAAFAFARLDLDQRELTVEFLTVQNELDLSAGDFVARIVAFGERVRAAIPNDDAPRAVLSGGNVSLEIAVVERMILDVHRQAAVSRRERRTLRHGPRSQHAVGLEPEIVVQSRGAMHLHHESQAAF